MKRFLQVLRIIFGLFFAFSGLGYFLGFMPLPQMTGTAKILIDAMVSSGYLMNFVKVTELIGGFLLLFDLLAPLALSILAPIILNILLFNLVLNPAMIVFSLVLTIIYLILVFNFRDRLTVIFQKENDSSKVGQSF